MPPKGDNKPRFPAARIKKMMQVDEDVGRIAAGVPPLVCARPAYPEPTHTCGRSECAAAARTAKCLELFGAELLEKATAAASREESKCVQVCHMCVASCPPPKHTGAASPEANGEKLGG